MATPMAFDIAAIQRLYGANTTARGGNDVYVLPDPGAGETWRALWDTGGIDDIVYNGTANAVIDLQPATLDDTATGGGVPSYTFTTNPDGTRDYGHGFTIAGDYMNALADQNGVTGVIIENASGGSGNDDITGNDAANILRGNAGNDRLDGRGGLDFLIGGTGDDTYVIGAGDTLDERRNEGTDTVETALQSFRLDYNVENLIFTGSGSFSGTGNSRDNTIVGGDGGDTLEGLWGDDTFFGGLGDDTMDGGSGGDIFVFENNFGDDRILSFDARPLGGQDLLDISALGITAATFNSLVDIEQVQNSTVITIGGDTIALVGVKNGVDITDFLLA